MPALICGSLAFDTITNFHGRFAQQILPEQVHILNVSFLVPTLRREYGGCAGNIAYTHKALGAEPIVMATLGSDGEDYRKRLESQGLDLSCVRRIDHNYTAQAIIITDESNNQITAFHPGAMGEAHLTAVPSQRSDIRLGIIAPDGRDAMMVHAQQMHAAGIPFIFDPGQGLPMFNGEELKAFVPQFAAFGTQGDDGANCGFKVSAPMCPVMQRRPSSTPRDAVMRSALPCSMVWSTVGRWNDASNWATALARSRSRTVVDRTIRWIGWPWV